MVSLVTHCARHPPALPFCTYCTASLPTPPAGVSTSTVSLVDVRNKMVAGALTLPHVRHVVPAAGRLAVLLGSGDLVVGYLYAIRIGSCVISFLCETSVLARGQSEPRLIDSIAFWAC